MNNLPTEIKCNMCPKGIMYPSRISLYHQYYKCNISKCNNTTGIPLNQYKENDSASDFGSGSYKSQREE